MVNINLSQNLLDFSKSVTFNHSFVNYFYSKQYTIHATILKLRLGEINYLVTNTLPKVALVYRAALGQGASMALKKRIVEIRSFFYVAITPERGVKVNTNEFSFSFLMASVGTAVSYWLGGWDIALKVLTFLMVFDYITGFLGAVKLKNVDSEVMFWGGVRKGIIFAVIIGAILLDEMMGNDQPILRTMAIYFYSGREGVSVTENLGILGVPLPPGIIKVLKQLQKKGKGK